MINLKMASNPLNWLTIALFIVLVGFFVTIMFPPPIEAIASIKDNATNG